MDKPLLTVDEQVIHLKNRGITFHLIDEEKAKDYLTYHNNLFNLSAYRKNFDKYVGGVNAGKYISLDFGHLRDLAVIDMQLRYAIVQLALDIEHYAKMDLLRILEEHREDGYQICSDYISQLDERNRNLFKEEINRNARSLYCRDLFEKYHDDYPVWAMLEMISFGQMIAFYHFCAQKYDSKGMLNTYYLLLASKEIRNAGAHNSCILNNLRPDKSPRPPKYAIINALSKIPSISANTREKRMSNLRMQQIITLLYAHNKIVTSAGVHDKASILLNGLKDRMLKNISYYDSTPIITSNFNFLSAVIDNWFPLR